MKKEEITTIINEIISKLPLPLSLVLFEEFVKELKEVKLPEIKEITKSIILRNVFISGTYKMLEVTGKGKIREAIIIINKPTINIYIEIDDREVINHSYDELSKISGYVEGIDAFQSNEDYIIRIANLSFIKKALIFLKANVLLKHGLVLYDIKEG